jgi:hypothetical protein
MLSSRPQAARSVEGTHTASHTNRPSLSLSLSHTHTNTRTHTHTQPHRNTHTHTRATRGLWVEYTAAAGMGERGRGGGWASREGAQGRLRRAWPWAPCCTAGGGARRRRSGGGAAGGGGSARRVGRCRAFGHWALTDRAERSTVLARAAGQRDSKSQRGNAPPAINGWWDGPPGTRTH